MPFLWYLISHLWIAVGRLSKCPATLKSDSIEIISNQWFNLSRFINQEVMATANISVTLCPTRHVCICVWGTRVGARGRVFVHVHRLRSSRNEGLAFARWQLSRGEFAIKRDDIIYRRTSYSREKEVADIGSRGKGNGWRDGGTSRRGAGPLRALIY